MEGSLFLKWEEDLTKGYSKERKAKGIDKVSALIHTSDRYKPA